MSGYQTVARRRATGVDERVTMAKLQIKRAEDAEKEMLEVMILHKNRAMPQPQGADSIVG
jgi:hypothetical protein